jgi:hypothetical protein
MKKPAQPSKDTKVKEDPQARKEAERAEAALENVREGYAQNDRVAKNQSGLNSVGSARDMTSGRHSGNQ